MGNCCKKKIFHKNIKEESFIEDIEDRIEESIDIAKS